MNRPLSAPVPCTLVTLVALLSAAPLSRGEAGALASTPPGAHSEARDQRVDPSYLTPLRWRFVGPYRGGRSVAVAGHPTETATFFLGTTGGGIWKTEDAGHSWVNVSDGFLESSSVGAIAASISEPAVLYAGMGESCIRGNVASGDGVYRSTDGGETWRNVGLKETRHIARIRIHPGDSQSVYVAALGDAWGPSVERGVFRSRDGGGSWEKVLYRGDGIGAIDLSMDPTNPEVLYAAMWDARRYPWGLRSGGPGSGIYKTTDGGTTWVELTGRPGFPSGTLGRIGIAVSPANPHRVWAIVEADGGETGLYVSDDAGGSWRLVNDQPSLAQRPFYYMHVVPDPKDPETVYVMNTSLQRSRNGGKTFSSLGTPHGDSHDLWIDPDRPERMIEANDGGGTVSMNGGQSWSSLLNQPTAQIYHVTTDNQFPYRVYGAQQDNTTISLPSRTSAGGIGQKDWYAVGGGEDGMIAVRPDDANVVYAGDHHWVHRYDHRTRQIRSISPWPESYRGWGALDMRYRFNWMTPVVLSPHDPDVLYVAGNVVLRSTDEGKSWETISPDLTKADESKLAPTPTWSNPSVGEYWGPVTRDNTGVEWYCTITAFAESPVARGVLWAGSDDGLVHVSRDDGRTWIDVTPKVIPEWALISIIEPSADDPAIAYIAATRYKLQDLSPYLLKTTDYGKTWTEMTDGIPGNDFTRVIREDPDNPDVLYVGTESGVHVSFDRGSSWQSLRLNLPVTPVHDLVVKNGDLVAATHGRGFWILDDVSPLSQHDHHARDGAHLFEVREAFRFRSGARSAVGRDPAAPEGENPLRGAYIHYYLPEARAALEMQIVDSEGRLVRRFSSAEGTDALPNAAGTNRFVWDLRHPGPVPLPGALYRPFHPVGPLAVPGKYEVRLTVADEVLVEPFEIVRDPRTATSDAEFAEQFALLTKVRDKISETHQAVIAIRNLREEVDEIVGAAKRAGRYEEDLRQLAESVNDQLWEIEDVLAQFRARVPHALNNFEVELMNKLTTLAGLVELGDGAPTKQDHELFADLSARLRREMEALRHVRETEIERLVTLAKSRAIPF